MRSEYGFFINPHFCCTYTLCARKLVPSAPVEAGQSPDARMQVLPHQLSRSRLLDLTLASWPREMRRIGANEARGNSIALTIIDHGRSSSGIAPERVDQIRTPTKRIGRSPTAELLWAESDY